MSSIHGRRSKIIVLNRKIECLHRHPKSVHSGQVSARLKDVNKRWVKREGKRKRLNPEESTLNNCVNKTNIFEQKSTIEESAQDELSASDPRLFPTHYHPVKMTHTVLLLKS